MKVFKNAWFGRFARKEKISADALWDAIERAENGQIDADLGGGVIKQRIARPGESKSKGYRSIVLFRKGELSFFVYGFSKSELGNIREDEEAQFKKMAKYVLSLTDTQLSELIANGQFEEVIKNA
ncbi:MAG: addiction module toxin RelE [Hydrogenophilales bacterium CG_4_9_14_3_um_filter_59_35]|nr:MAG: addiction module toxin RelE [Hydrogenophilales bacterium CG18_big_fil_WC_8_21_14_2_50_58_12]PIY00224.1 MAG: addiction module toxin RelE [Hydrogenophilales bacterium CG_4_10_14_3_um_filter_58_23]PJB07527.1 MAG: addiction module toxin RelE [Hydrogenophilales bacterium CG_4_9_14_3_um_filter_59_35]